MFCSNCGKQLFENAKFCSECGTQTSVVSSNAVEASCSNLSVELNDLDMATICKQLNYNKILIVKHIMKVQNLSMPDAKNMVDNYFTDNPKPSFGQRLMEQANEINAAKEQEKSALKERIKQMDRDGVAYCPKCYSTSISANKKGFGIGKAVVGAAVTMNAFGLVAGNAGAKKVRVTCLKCGHQWMAGK
ncbi:MAG: zinc-ribbon domain-containing protein [Angelakisella sp.]